MLAALCLAMVFAISLSSYIALCYVSLAMSTRNLASAHSSELAEAGIEQAIYASNNNSWTGWTKTTVGSIATETTAMTMTSSGLLASGGTPLNYGNGINGTVNITLTYTAGSPTAIQSITSQGVMKLPKGSIISGEQPIISRTLTYGGAVAGVNPTASAPIFVNAVAGAAGKVKFSAGGTLDSYNSNPSSGTYQVYSTGVAGYSAVVASLDNTATGATVALKSAVVHGYVTGYNYPSPSSTNWLSYMNNAAKVVGYNSPTGTYIDASRVITSPVPYQPVFPEILPTPTVYLGNLTSSTTLGTAGASAPTIYDVNSITLGSGAVITVQGPSVIIAYGSTTISGTGAIVLTTRSASLQIFQEYGSMSIGGNGITNTNTIGTTGIPALPKRVSLLSTNNSSFTVAFSTTTPFYGVVYFPYMAITISSSATFYGSIVGQSVDITGSPTIHYDNALRSPDSTVGDAAFDYVTAPITVSGIVSSVP